MQIILILIGGLLIFELQSHIFRVFWDKNLNISIAFSAPHATVGDKLYLTEIIENRKALPLPVIHAKFMTSRHLVFDDTSNSNISDNFYRDDLLSIFMYQKLTRELKFDCSHRGYFTIDKADIVCNDAFLAQSMVQTIYCNQILYVYPKLYEDSKIVIPFNKMLGAILTKRHFNVDPFEFASIREYQTYDQMRDINWKASAKTGDLKVNVHNYTASQQIKIILNLEAQALVAYEELAECAISLAATYANAFIQAGIPTSICTNGVDLITHQKVIVQAGSGNQHMTKINEGLSRIDTSLKTEPFLPYFKGLTAQVADNEYILLISTYQRMELQEELLRLKKLNHDFFWIVPLNSQIDNQIVASLTSNSFVCDFTY